MVQENLVCKMVKEGERNGRENSLEVYPGHVTLLSAAIDGEDSSWDRTWSVGWAPPPKVQMLT